MGVMLALVSAISYGLSDFLGGVLSRRAPFVRVALLGQVGGLGATVLAAPLSAGALPGPADLVWGGLSGVGTGLGMTFLFRGMSRGAISVVVPVSAVGGVVLPVLVAAVVLGDRPAPLAWAGTVLAVPALWWVSREPASARGTGGVADGLVAGGGIALQYLALAQAAPAAGIWPVAAGRVTATAAVGVLAIALGRREPDRTVRASACGVRAAAAGAGVLAALALVCYLFATRTELVAVAVVLSSLYPVVPVLLGVTALRERLGRAQALGLAGALAGCVLIATS
ncbi:EamA family transporter [Pseudonocardia sp. MH-G8]|uniref:EamA family transporter n=1 Tax=Pseudonocardia sp. MH-G8 TaxID=1854588 RepID=UPI000BA17147|nr:EamA family transporter [Pseudonocardia sp. MH-G8]OZM80347.1 multidrug DMT transporter permease [Pseudonocardia sp. MH-G8]